MTYPRILLTHPIRRAIMIGLMALFLLLAPALLLYSAGYRYDPKTRRIKVTGVISIEAQPADATVTINNVRLNKRLPFELTNRAPGQYRLRLEKPGYRPWEKEITVESKQTTYIKHITLLRDQLPVPVPWVIATTSVQFSASPDGHYLLGQTTAANIETITLFETRRATGAVISRRAANQSTLVSWSPNSIALLLVTKQKPGWRLSLINLLQPSQTNHYSLAENQLPRLQWSKADDETVFFQTDQSISGLNLNRVSALPDRTTTSVWFVDEERRLSTIDDVKRITGNIRLEIILDINEARIIGQTEAGTAVIRRTGEPNQVLTLPTTDFHYNPVTDEWLVWSEFELWTIYQNGEVRLLNRSGDRIRAVYPLDQTGVLLVQSDRGLTAFNPGYQLAHDLFIGQVDSAGVNQAERLIYFLGEVAGRHGVFQLGY